MSDTDLPSEDELARLGRDLKCKYPASYARFLRCPEPWVLEAFKKCFPKGWFVKSFDDIREFAKFTRGEMAPFFVEGQREQMADIGPYDAPSGLLFFGFDLMSEVNPDLEDPPVVVFRVHTYVGQWRSFRHFTDYIKDRDNVAWTFDQDGFYVRKDRDEFPAC